MTSQPKTSLKTLSGSTMRRLRNTPSYFFLIWRWSMWLYALVTTLYSPLSNTPIMHVLLVITFLQTLTVTLYAPVLQIFLPNLPRLRAMRTARQTAQRRQPLAEDEDADIMTPLASTHNRYWDVAFYALDVVICGLVMYFGVSGVTPAFGDGSLFYRYGISTIFAAALAYRYRGGLAAALGFELFVLLGVVLPPFNANPGNTPTVIDYVGSLVDAPVVALLSAYVATLLKNYTQSKRREQDNARTQQALVRVSETLIRGAHDRQQLLQTSASQMRQGGHFQRLVIALVETSAEDDDEPQEHEQAQVQEQVQNLRYIEADVDVPTVLLPSKDEAPFQRVLQSGKKLIMFEPLHEPENKGYFLARLYIPLLKDGRVQLILAAEGRRQAPFNEKQEKFLTISGTQLLLVLDNLRLTEQTIRLAGAAERGRIAREIHDGIAQLVYMLSLNAETSATQARRIAEASEEDAELINPLAARLENLVTISKQALWETRNYMFNLKPLMSGSTTLEQMISNQLREFQAISGLATYLEIDSQNGTTTSEGKSKGKSEGDTGVQVRRSRHYAQVGTAIFRIVQEALTNAYKHAEATQIQVALHQRTNGIEVTIRDNGRGLQKTAYDYELATNGEQERMYSGRGLQGMRERAAELGGTVTITSLAGNGTQILAYIPTHDLATRSLDASFPTS